MRTDFTGLFTTQKNAKENRPINLLRIDWPAIGVLPAKTVYLSSRPLTIGAITPIPLVESWGKLNSFVSQFAFQEKSVSDLAVSAINAPVDFGDGPERFSALLNRYPAQAATVFLYQWFDDPTLDDLDLAPLFVASLEDSRSYDEALFEFDLVDISVDAGQTPVGGMVTKTQYPNAPADSMGKAMPIPIGDVPDIPGILVRDANKTRLTSVVIPGASILKVEATAGFNAQGSLKLNDDTLQYTGLTATQFTGVTGVNDFHFKDNEVIEKINDRRYLFADPAFTIQAIKNVKKGGFLADSNDFSIDLPKGEVVFKTPPQVVTGFDTKFINPFFDQVVSGNTALDPQNAIDIGNRTSAAKISQANPLLKLQQTDTVPPIGEMNAVLLRVEHGAEEKIPNDQAVVRLNGTQVGILSPPSPDDQALTAGSIQIVLDHLDTLGFTFTEPAQGHNHQLPQPTVISQQALTGLQPEGIRLDSSNNFGQVFSFDPLPNGVIIKMEYQIGFKSLKDEGAIITTKPAARMFFGGTGSVNDAGQVYFSDLLFGSEPIYSNPVVWTGRRGSGSWNNAARLATDANGSHELDNISSVTRIATYEDLKEVGQNTDLGSNLKSGDVDTHNDNADLSATTEKTTQTIPQFFDITSLVNDDWNFFKDAVVEVEYLGSADGRTVFVFDVGFRIEFTRRVLSLTDDISADVEGVIDDASGTVTGTPNALIEKPGDLFKSSVLLIPGRTLSDIDTPSFAAAAAKWDAAIPGGYKAAGVIQGDQVLRTLWDAWMKEFRCDVFFDPFNKFRVLYKPSFESDEVSGQEVKTIVEGMILKRRGEPARIEITKSPKAQLVNHIDLMYDRNLVSDGWDSVLTRGDSSSQSDFGRRQKPTEFKFEFTRGDAQAADIADFWLGQKRRAFLTVECDVLLDQMELEKGDVVKIGHPLLSPGNVFAQILRRTRTLGATKERRMNLIRLFIKVFPISIFKQAFAESVTVTESFSTLIGFLKTFSELIDVTETQSFKASLLFQEGLEIVDPAGFGIQPFGTSGFGGRTFKAVVVSDSVFFNMGEVINEIVNVTDVLLANIKTAESETITVSESASFNEGGFGIGPFGSEGFGGNKPLV